MRIIKAWMHQLKNLFNKQIPPIENTVDEASEESFPASDAPAWADVTKSTDEPKTDENYCYIKDMLPKRPGFRSLNSLQTLEKLHVGDRTYHYFSLAKAEAAGLAGLTHLPFSLKILLENLLRHEDGRSVTFDDIKALVAWLENRGSDREIAYRPARVLLQDFTGVPAIVDLAAMRDAIKQLGGDSTWINPLSPVDLVIDHSVQVDAFLTKDAFATNAELEMQRNYERYAFLRWGQQAFQNFQVVPPDTGICHQVNLEYLAKVVWTDTHAEMTLAYPDTLVGTDSHTTMINGLGILGWGVGGIEAEAAMLGQPISMLIPPVIGVKLTGKLPEGIMATDLVLAITHMLRKKGVVGKFVEFFGSGLNDLSIADRATISNMSPEYGATCGFFPIDQATLDYLRLSGRDAEALALVEAYSKAQGLWYDAALPDPHYTEVLTFDLATLKPCLAGPKRPQDQVGLSDVKTVFQQFLSDNARGDEATKAFATSENFSMHHGDVVIAAITSCTNTSNPQVLIAAALVAKAALAKGLQRKPWVKTSFAPGSQVVTNYLEKLGLQTYLDQLGFNLVGYGCTTCIGNSGPLPDLIAKTVAEHDLTVAAVLSGNRNFEGRIHPQVKANWLASPPLVVAYALTGTITTDLTTDPVGFDGQNQPVFLKDIWPSNAEITQAMAAITSDMFTETYRHLFKGTEAWRNMQIPQAETYTWQPDSTYIQSPPFFTGMTMSPEPITDIHGARILAILGDSITTDHISPASSIKPDSPAGLYLQAQGVAIKDFNSYGSRRGNHEVMMRGTFANIRIRNEMTPGIEGGVTKYYPGEIILPIYDAAMRYQAADLPLVVIAGKEYGSGSSRDWAAKGPKLLGVKAVIAESFERIHRSNLIGMGILPLEFTDGMTRKTFTLTGAEEIDLLELAHIKPMATIRGLIRQTNGEIIDTHFKIRIDTLNELDYYHQGGILQHVIRHLMKQKSAETP